MTDDSPANGGSGYLGPYPLDSIITGDARVLGEQVPDESVDLVFTDPVYDRIDDYRWLASTACRVLKPGGLCVAYYWPGLLPAVVAAMSNLLFRANINELKIGVASLDGSRSARVMLRPALAWSKTFHSSAYWLSDLVYSRPMGREINHVWSKNPSATIQWLKSIPGSITFDPFTGGGTVPAICKMLGRRFLAFEIDPAVAERARIRVANTQPAWPEMVQALQGSLL